MDFIWNKITEWLKGIMIGGIMGNLQGLFDNVNTQVGGIAGQVGSTPQAWNSSVYGMIRSLSDNVILPIAGVILAIVMTMELLQLVLEKNNMQNFETWVFFKWMFKTFCAVMIVTNTWNIIMGVFDAAQSVVNSAAGIIGADTAIDLTQVIGDLEARLQEMEIGPLLGLWFQTLFVGVTIHALSICIFVIVYGRMMEIYIVTSLAPIPMATMMNHDWGQMGQSYLKSLFALGFQAFLIIVCVAIYAVLVHTIAVETDVVAAIWTCIGYTVLLCFSLFKSGGVAKGIFGAH
ncbi:MAG: CD0415/CD1112 family protein [Clostridia bacterium]